MPSRPTLLSSKHKAGELRVTPHGEVHRLSAPGQDSAEPGHLELRSKSLRGTQE